MESIGNALRFPLNTEMVSIEKDNNKKCYKLQTKYFKFAINLIEYWLWKNEWLHLSPERQQK